MNPILFAALPEDLKSKAMAAEAAGWTDIRDHHGTLLGLPPGETILPWFGSAVPDLRKEESHREPNPILPMPDCAGEWDFSWHGLSNEWLFMALCFGPRQADKTRRVLVTETPAAGRLCRELGMGGSIHCGLAPWSGQWRRV